MPTTIASTPRRASGFRSRSKASASARRISIRSWRFSIRTDSSSRRSTTPCSPSRICFLSVVIPEDGEYTILVRETSYRGADNCRYRLHVGNFPRPTVAYPAGGKRGEQLKVQFLGDATGPIEREITVPADPQAIADQFVEDEQGVTPSAVPFRAFCRRQHPGNGTERCVRNGDAGRIAAGAQWPTGESGRRRFLQVHRQEGAGLGSRMLCPAHWLAGRSGRQHLQGG